MKSADVLIGKWGRILAGENAGLYVFVQDDSATTGGFFIFQSREKSIEQGFDNWAETLDAVRRFFEFAGWEVEWSE
jgi:hypothetical protein